MKIQESGEMYLEYIWILKETNNNIRAIDIVNISGYSKPSISRALSVLKNNGFIQVNDQGYISLTEKGELNAKKIYERHKTLHKFLIKIGVPEDIADKDACKLEHIISDETFEAIKKLI